jgi:hypothetical protein
MKLATVWIVRDPGPQSELVDVVFDMDARRLGDYVTGAGAGVWQREHHTLFTGKDEAVAEGIRRLVQARPGRERWIRQEAQRVFGCCAPRESQ